MNKIKMTFLACLLLACVSCSDAQWKNNISSLGVEHTITLYSGGKQVGQWTSTGKVNTEANSDGYIFVNKATGKLIRVAGTVIVEQK